jgi:hypothetical protein
VDRKGIAGETSQCDGTLGWVGMGSGGLPWPMCGIGPAAQEVQAAVQGDPGSAAQECKAVQPHSRAAACARCTT